MSNQNFTTYAYTDTVQAAQERYGARRNGERMENSGDRFVLTDHSGAGLPSPRPVAR